MLKTFSYVVLFIQNSININSPFCSTSISLIGIPVGFMYWNDEDKYSFLHAALITTTLPIIKVRYLLNYLTGIKIPLHIQLIYNKVYSQRN